MTAPALGARLVLGLRLSWFYAAFFAVIGIILPFWPVWLKARGLGATEIGIVLAAAAIARTVLPPFLAHLADRRGWQRPMRIVLAAAATLAFALFDWMHGFWPVLLVMLLHVSLWSPVMPLGESAIILSAREHGLEYGRVRLWGSLSFILVAAGAGRVLVGRSEDAIYWMAIATLIATLSACILLPEPARGDGSAARPSLRRVLVNGPFLLFLASGGLIQASHGVYYAFGTLHWKAVGYSEDIIGLLWAEGVIAEIVLFAVGAAVTRRVGPCGMIVIGGLAAVVRWTVTGLSDSLPVLLVVQALHAGTFGATHLGAIAFLARAVPPSLTATAMSLYGAGVMGVSMGTAMAAAGPLYAAFGGRAYLAMAAVGVVGTGVAAVLARRWRFAD